MDNETQVLAVTRGAIMLVLCAWCQKEGKETVIKGDPNEGGPVSHGICTPHQEKMLDEIRAQTVRKANPRKRRRRKR